MTEETGQLLREPGTPLGEAIYRSIRLKSVENVFSGEGQTIAADVVLTTIDTLSVMGKAAMIFAEQVTQEGPAEDPDQAIAEIYDELLAREDLPLIDHFCIVRMTITDGRLLIDGDQAFIQAVEGSADASQTAIGTLFLSEE